MESNGRKGSVCVCVCSEHVETRDWCQAPFSVVHHLIFVIRLLTELEVSIFAPAALAGLISQWMPCLHTLTIGIRDDFISWFYVGCWGLNSGLFAWANTSPTQSFFFNPKRISRPNLKPAYSMGLKLIFFSPWEIYLIPKKKSWGQGNFSKNCPQSPWAWNIWGKQQQTSW